MCLTNKQLVARGEIIFYFILSFLLNILCQMSGYIDWRGIVIINGIIRSDHFDNILILNLLSQAGNLQIVKF